jgi:hypothetical protein
MGIGFRADRWRGRARICHGGDGLGTTNAVAALPGEGVAVVLLANLGQAQGLRSELLHAALSALTGEAPEVAPFFGAPAAVVEGRYRSTFWDVDVDLTVDDDGAMATVVAGATIPARPCVSRLVPRGDRRLEGAGGMFDGCDLVFETEPARFHGGLYPYTFERVGPLAAPPPPPDPGVSLEGRWSGTCESLLGEEPVHLALVGDGVHATLLHAEDAPLDAVNAAHGRVEGELSVDVPGLGEWRLFFRLVARSGVLEGDVIARGDFGEFRMPTRLARTG